VYDMINTSLIIKISLYIFQTACNEFCR